MNTKSLLIVGSALGLLTLGGCGGGGGSGTGGGSSGGGSSGSSGPSITGNGFAPNTGPGDTQHYFPSGAGDEWYYSVSTDDASAAASTSVDKVFVNGTQPVLGATATVFTQQNSSTPSESVDNYYNISPGGVTLLGNTDQTDTITPAIVPVTELLFPVNTGTVSSISATGLPAGTDNAGNALKLDLTQTIRNMGVEAINAPAGNFSNAMKQVTTVSGTVHDAATGQSATLSGTDTDWLVPGVGIVAEVISITGGGTTINDARQLRGYAVNGVHHGMGVPFTAAAGLAPAGASDLNRSPTAAGFDGSHFALAYQTVSGSGPNFSGDWNLRIFSLDGSYDVQTSNVTGILSQSGAPESAAIASDGTGFLVAIEQASQVPPTPPNPVILAGRFVADHSGVQIPVAVTSGGDYSPALAFDGTRYLLAYAHDPVAGVGQVFGLFISPQTGQPVGAAFPITALGSTKQNLSVAFDGTNYLVVWADAGNSGPGAALTPGVYATRVATDGTVVDAAPIAVAVQSPPSLATPSNPVVAFDGSNYLVAYLDYRTPDGIHTRISAARLSPSTGQLLDGTPTTAGIAVTSDTGTVNGPPTLAFIGGDFWISWASTQSGTIADGAYAARVTTAGVVASPGSAGFLVAPSGSALYPAATGNASGGLLTWTWTSAPPISGTSNSIGAVSIYPAGP